MGVVKLKMFSIISLIFLLSTAHGGDLTLFEGNDGSEDQVCTLRWSRGLSTWNFKNFDACKNDEARSAILYSAADGATSDDYVQIKVRGRVTKPVLIATFESSLDIKMEEGLLEVRFHSKNGLDGKVSRVEIIE